MAKENIEKQARTIDVKNVSRHNVYQLSIFLRDESNNERLETKGLFFANDDGHAAMVANGIVKVLGYKNASISFILVSEGWLWG